MNHVSINLMLQSSWRAGVVNRPGEFALEMFRGVVTKAKLKIQSHTDRVFADELDVLLEMVGDARSLTVESLRGIDQQMDTLQTASRRASEARAGDQGPAAIFIPGFGLRAQALAEGLLTLGLQVRTEEANSRLDLKPSEEQRIPQSGIVLVGGAVVEDEVARAALVDATSHHDSDLLVVLAVDAPLTFQQRLLADSFGPVKLLGPDTDVRALRALIRNRARDSEIHGYKVLLLDDSKTDAWRATTFMQEQGIEVHHILTPHEVLDAIETFRPDVIVTDFHMPGANGDQVASVIRQDNDSTLPIVFLSSERNVETQLLALSKGADAFVPKPLQRGAFIKALKSLIARSKAYDARMRRDPLTGLLNHGQLMACATRIGCAEMHRPSSLVMIDIDHFKSVNDTFGHPVGDKVLVALAEVLSENLRSTDYIGRMGGEEFAVVMVGADTGSAVQVIDRIRDLFSSVQFESGLAERGPNGQWFGCTFSAGVAMLDGAATAALKSADEALYRAKRQGRNRVETSDWI